MPPSTSRSSMEAQNGSTYSTSQIEFPAKVSHSGGFRNKLLISSRTTTTTSTSTTTTKTSLPTVPLCQWKQPELSIGAPCQSMDVLGRYKCWSLKDNSPAHIIWKTLSKAIIALLQGQMEHLASRDSDLMVEMFMIGRKAKTSSPTVLFSCESKSCRQQALELLKRKSILASYPGVLAAECSRLPRLLALGEAMDVPILPSGVYVNGPLRSCGMDVLISTGPHRLPRKATVGGIVCIDNDYYGLTCVHAFSEIKTPDAGEDRDLEFAFYGLNDDYGLGESDDEDDSVEMTSQGSISSRSSQSLTTNEVANLQASLQKLDQNFTERGQNLYLDVFAESKRQVTEPTLLGTFFAGPPKSSLDWALVKIEHWGFLLPFSTTSLDPEVDIAVNKIISGDRVVYPKHIARATADARVLICTGSTGTACEGTLSSVASFTKATRTEKFQELWSVRRLDGSFVDGDCGSWVVDFESGVLYGHIVSGYPGTESAYVVPAVQVFYDMKQYLGKTVQLSTAERKASLLLSNRLEVNHISETAGMGIDATVSPPINQPAKDSRPSEWCLPSSSFFVGSSATIRAKGDVSASVSDNTISSPIPSPAPLTSSTFPPSQSLIEHIEFPQEEFITGGNEDLSDIQSSAHSPSPFRLDSSDEEVYGNISGSNLLFDRKIAMEKSRTPQANTNTPLAVNRMGESTQNPSGIPNPPQIKRSRLKSIVPMFPFEPHITKDKRAIQTKIQLLETKEEVLQTESPTDRTMYSSDRTCPEDCFENPGFDVQTIATYSQPEKHPIDYIMPVSRLEDHNSPARKPAGWNSPMSLYTRNSFMFEVDGSEDGFDTLFPKQINDNPVGDDENDELFKDPVTYAENSPSIQAHRPTNPQIPISRMAGLSLNTNSAAYPASLNPSTTRTSMPHVIPMSPTTLTNSGPLVNYQLGSQNYQRHNFPPANSIDQNPPCNTLYVGNVPIDSSEDELKAMFSKQPGYKRLCFRTRQNGPMCFVEFEDVSFATKALHELYGNPLQNSIKGGIRLSFSKNPLGVRSGQGISSLGPPNAPGFSTNGVVLGNTVSTFSMPSGPQPQMVIPPGLGPNVIGAVSPVTGPAGQYAASPFAGNSNSWNRPTFASAVAARGGRPSGPSSTVTK